MPPKSKNTVQCNVCKGFYKTKRSLNQHMKRIHVDERRCVECSQCHKIFVDIKGYKYHLQNVCFKTEDEINAELSKLEQGGGLTIIYRKIRQEPILECPLCKKTYSTQMHLKRHFFSRHFKDIEECQKEWIALTQGTVKRVGKRNQQAVTVVTQVRRAESPVLNQFGMEDEENGEEPIVSVENREEEGQNADENENMDIEEAVNVNPPEENENRQGEENVDPRDADYKHDYLDADDNMKIDLAPEGDETPKNIEAVNPPPPEDFDPRDIEYEYNDSSMELDVESVGAALKQYSGEKVVGPRDVEFEHDNHNIAINDSYESMEHDEADLEYENQENSFNLIPRSPNVKNLLDANASSDREDVDKAVNAPPSEDGDIEFEYNDASMELVSEPGASPKQDSEEYDADDEYEYEENSLNMIPRSPNAENPVDADASPDRDVAGCAPITNDKNQSSSGIPQASDSDTRTRRDYDHEHVGEPGAQNHIGNDNNADDNMEIEEAVTENVPEENENLQGEEDVDRSDVENEHDDYIIAVNDTDEITEPEVPEIENEDIIRIDRESDAEDVAQDSEAEIVILPDSTEGEVSGEDEYEEEDPDIQIVFSNVKRLPAPDRPYEEAPPTCPPTINPYSTVHSNPISTQMVYRISQECAARNLPNLPCWNPKTLPVKHSVMTKEIEKAINGLKRFTTPKLEYLLLENQSTHPEDLFLSTICNLLYSCKDFREQIMDRNENVISAIFRGEKNTTSDLGQLMDRNVPRGLHDVEDVFANLMKRMRYITKKRVITPKGRYHIMMIDHSKYRILKLTSESIVNMFGSKWKVISFAEKNGNDHLVTWMKCDRKWVCVNGAVVEKQSCKIDFSEHNVRALVFEKYGAR